MDRLGYRIRTLRELNGWSMAELASRCDCDAASVCNWEKGKTQPHLDKVCALAQALHTTVEALTGNAEYCRDAEIKALKEENARLRRVIVSMRGNALEQAKLAMDSLMRKEG